MQPGWAQVKFRRISTAQGLSQSSVLAMHQDRQGFLWFATADGLNRYDGYGFTIYRHQQRDSASLSSSDVTTVSEDGFGRIWVGTVASGVNYLDPQTGRFRRVSLPTSQRPGLMVSGLWATGSDVWVGTYDRGLFHINTPSMTVRWLCQAGGPVLEANTTAVAPGRDNTCWAGVGKGIVYKLDAHSRRPLRRFVIPTGRAYPRISALFEDKQQRLWIGTDADGLFRLDPGQTQPRRVRYTPGLAAGTNAITAFCVDKRGTLWIGTDDGVLAAPAGDLAAAVPYLSGPESETGLSSHAVKSLLADRSGNLWIGTWEAGLNVAYQQSERFRTLTFKPNAHTGLLTRKVTAVGGDGRGTIWIGSGAGLVGWQPATNRFVSYLRGYDINALYNQPISQPLLAVWNRGFGRLKVQANAYRPERLVLPIASLSSAWAARSFAPASRGRVWVSAQQTGPLLYDPGRLTTTELNQTAEGQNLRGVQPTALCHTADSVLWMGTFNDGLWAYDLRTGRSRHYRTGNRPGDLSENHVLTLLEDHRKRLWIGTNGGGLNHFDPQTGRFAVYTTANGLSNNTIKSLLEDQRGNLWVSTNDGLSRLSTNDRRICTFSVADGLPEREFMAQAAYRDPNGYLYFGSMNGLTYFHPDSVVTTGEPLPVYLTGLRLFNRPVVVGAADSPLHRPVGVTHSITLRADQSVFTLDFLGLNFQNAPAIQYAYRLDGFDTDWNRVGSQRSATYTNLDAGQYVFRVRAANGSGRWSEMRTPLTIRILPPWYRTGWAFLAYSLLLAAALWTLRRILMIRERFRSDLRVQRIEAANMRELDRLKTNFFTNISHEFRTPLTLIISPLEQLLSRESGDASLRQQHGLMYRNARRLLRLINQLLDLSKLEAGHLRPRLYANTLPDFIERIVRSFDLSARQHGQTLDWQTDFPDQPVWYDPDLLEKVLTNLLANALKYTPDGGRITVRLRWLADGYAELSVADTGLGIAPGELTHIFDRFYRTDGQEHRKTVGTGVGLALTKELVELIQGTISVHSAVGKGSTFTVRFPVEARYFTPSVLHKAASVLPVGEPFTESPVPTAPMNENQSAEQQTLLLVEDNDDLRAYIRSLFAGRFTVLEAANGQTGWEKALATVPDFIITDLVMPEQNGIELCRLVKQHPHTSHIPVLLLTARQNSDSQLDGLRAGADDYVVKPFNAQLLESRVSNILRSRQQLRERFSRVITVTPSEVTATSADEQLMARALQLVEARMDDPALSIADLEDALNLSESLLYRKLKSLTGLSGVEFIRSVRLKRAAQWLRTDSGLSVSEIAFRVGFRDPAYFTRCFTKEFGQSPKQYGREVIKL